MRRSAPASFGSMAVRPPHAEPGQRIGLLGGSFNPPHEAHLLISQIALSRLGLDKVWWIVTPGNPLKAHDGLPPLHERMALCRRLASDRRIVVTGFEADLQTSFTAATLSHLAARFPETHFVWVMGADCLAEFHRWRHWRQIFETMPIAVVDRPGWHLRAIASVAARTFAAARLPAVRGRSLPVTRPPAWTFLIGPLSSQSSTALRKAAPGATGRRAGAIVQNGNAGRVV